MQGDLNVTSVGHLLLLALVSGDRGGGRGASDRGGGHDSGRSYENSRYDGGSRSGGGGGGSYGSDSRGNGSYGQGSPPLLAAIPSYDSSGSYPLPMGYGMEAVPLPSSYAGGPPSYGGPTGGYGGDAPGTGGRGGRGGSYDGDSAPRRQEPSYGDAPAEKVKQCDKNCDNAIIFINNLPPDVTTDELKDLFGDIGQVITLVFFYSFCVFTSGNKFYLEVDSCFCICLLVC